jgi:hypothetical protein
MVETETNNDDAIKAEDKRDDDVSEDGDEGEAPSLVVAKPEDDSGAKLKQELEDESPKTFPQVVRDIGEGVEQVRCFFEIDCLQQDFSFAPFAPFTLAYCYFTVP